MYPTISGFHHHHNGSLLQWMAVRIWHSLQLVKATSCHSLIPALRCGGGLPVGGPVALGRRCVVPDQAIGVDGRLGLGYPDHAVSHFRSIVLFCCQGCVCGFKLQPSSDRSCATPGYPDRYHFTAVGKVICQHLLTNAFCKVFYVNGALHLIRVLGGSLRAAPTAAGGDPIPPGGGP